MLRGNSEHFLYAIFMEKNNINRLGNGIVKDASPIDQPQNSYRFVLNGIQETKKGDLNFIGNAESNVACAEFPENYVPIGKEYIGKGNTVIFLVNRDETSSEIGILNEYCRYKTIVNADLGFKITNQIDATFKLRRGCGRTIYWVDGCNNPPMIFNLDKPEDFQDTNGIWDIDKFSLFKTTNSIPEIINIQTEETGELLPGSYNFAIQYLDQDFNGTEWLSTTDTVIIYNDNPNGKEYSAIRGSTNLKEIHRNYGKTNKSIVFDLAKLDANFIYYRIAIIHSTNGSGEVSGVFYTKEIPLQIDSFTYTGNESFTKGTVEDVQQFQNIIAHADHIEQIENRLTLAKTKGKDVEYCKLQNCASQITADLVFEEIYLNNIEIPNNPKRGVYHLEKVGYMPGEIYSFGIVYLFKDGTKSPVFHIPGRAQGYLSSMSLDNQAQDDIYIDNKTCCNYSYWGVDSQGQNLVGTPIRHHRFPLRSEVNRPLFYQNSSNQIVTNYELCLDIAGNINPLYLDDEVTVLVTYTVGGTTYTKLITVDLTNYNPTNGIACFFIDQNTSPLVFTSAVEQPSPVSGLVPGLTYIGEYEQSNLEISDTVYRSEIMGIRFDNIKTPQLPGDNEIIGYYIVRNERTEKEKTILDNGILTPLIIEKRQGVERFVAHGHLAPNTTDLKEDVMALIHPEFKFRGREYSNTTEYIQEGEYVINTRRLSDEIVQDVQAGTSYDPSINKRREEDSDGFDLHVGVRYNSNTFTSVNLILAQGGDIAKTFYLDALHGNTITDTNGDRKEIFNLSTDNKIGFLQLNTNLDTTVIKDRLPYVVMKRDLNNPYSAFRVLPYFKENDNPIYFTNAQFSAINLFNGDSYISPMNYLSTVQYDIRLRERRTKKGILNWIIGVLAVVGGTALTIFSAGTLAVAGLGIIGYGISELASGIKQLQTSIIYQQKYEQGLKDTVDDLDTQAIFSQNPPDDEIQFFHDILPNIFIESGVNMNWRMGNTVGLTDFLDSPNGYDELALNTYAIEKLTTVDPEAKGGRNYLGYTKAELYNVNLDYFRRNREKIFTHLSFQYDCCSKCAENFPHRIAYSNQSFSEELTDNYRVFLPNNYRDIEGETGAITNTFRLRNNLYIQTEEALWHLPQNFQERVTGDIISFIGTGEFFGIPPRKIIEDSTGHSAGTQHKWSVLEFPNGVIFVSERERKIYHFNGSNINPISTRGLDSWFKENLDIQENKNYSKINNRLHPFNDNPSNPFGTGFISVYDSRYDRVIITKRDNILENILPDTEYEICLKDGSVILFDNIEQTVTQEQLDGWCYRGIENCQMCFERVIPGSTINEIEYKCIDGIKLTIQPEDIIKNSWTISYSLKNQTWISWHSYLPNFYLHTPNKFYSWITDNNNLWKHNKHAHYQTYYGVYYSFIVDYVAIEEALQSKIWDYIRLLTEARKYQDENNSFYEERFITFNKLIAYNRTQTTGLINLIVKNTENNFDDYLENQVLNNLINGIKIDRNEKDWTLNTVRDLRVNHHVPLFNKSIEDLQVDYYIDKVLNQNAIDYNKNWWELEVLRDKYLEVRLIFDILADTKLIFHFGITNQKTSFR